MFKFLSAKDIKEIILAGKDANCENIVYNGLHITYQKVSAPSETLWPLPTPTILTDKDNPTKDETIAEEAGLMAADLQYKLHEDPVAFEEALAQGAEWTHRIKQTK